MSKTELTLIINSLFKQFKWFPLCVKSIRGYEQPDVVNYTPQAKEYIDRDYMQFISIAKKPSKSKTTTKKFKKPNPHKNRNNDSEMSL